MPILIGKVKFIYIYIWEILTLHFWEGFNFEHWLQLTTPITLFIRGILLDCLIQILTRPKCLLKS